jgi:hypothetical protein
MSQQPSQRVSSKETCSFYKRDLFRRFSAHPASGFLKHIVRNWRNPKTPPGFCVWISMQMWGMLRMGEEAQRCGCEHKGVGLGARDDMHTRDLRQPSPFKFGILVTRGRGSWSQRKPEGSWMGPARYTSWDAAQFHQAPSDWPGRRQGRRQMRGRGGASPERPLASCALFRV